MGWGSDIQREKPHSLNQISQFLFTFCSFYTTCPSDFLASHSPFLYALCILDPLDYLLFLKLPCTLTPPCLAQVVPLAKVASSPLPGKLLFITLRAQFKFLCLPISRIYCFLPYLLIVSNFICFPIFSTGLLVPWEPALYLSHLLSPKQLPISRHSINVV